MNKDVGTSGNRPRWQKEAFESSKTILENEAEGPFNVAMQNLLYNFTGVYKFINKLNREVLWTKDMVEEMHDLSENLPSMKPGDVYEVRAFDGDIERLSIPDLGENQHLGIEIVGHQTLSQILDDNGDIRTRKNKYRRVPFFVTVRGETYHLKFTTCFPKPGMGPWNKVSQTPWDYWKNKWEDGHFKKDYIDELRRLINKNASALKDVDNIVCFALGYLDTGDWLAKDETVEHPRRYVQHLAAKTIREEIKKLNQKDVPITAQDPEYCDNCKKVLKETLDIEAITSCDGFLQITENTLVVCISPGTTIRGVIADITHSFKGPLAMLCDEIEVTDAKIWKDGAYRIEPWLKWDKWDGRESSSSYEGEKPIPNDHTTKNMAEYCKRCHCEEFHDFAAFKGITFKKSRTECSDWPSTIKELDTRVEAYCGLDDDLGHVEHLVKKYGKDYTKSEEFKKETLECKRISYTINCRNNANGSYDEHFQYAKSRNDPNFGDLNFYIRSK